MVADDGGWIDHIPSALNQGGTLRSRFPSSSHAIDYGNVNVEVFVNVNALLFNVYRMVVKIVLLQNHFRTMSGFILPAPPPSNGSEDAEPEYTPQTLNALWIWSKIIGDNSGISQEHNPMDINSHF